MAQRSAVGNDGCELCEAVIIGEVHRTTSGFCTGEEIARARVVSRFGDIDRLYRLRPLPQPGGHGVETIEGASS